MGLSIVGLQAQAATFMVIISVIALVLLIASYRKFLGGDFKKIIQWLIIILFFLTIHESFMSLYMARNSEIIEFISLSSLFLTILSILYLTFQLYNFSKVYGFADFEEKITTFTVAERKLKAKRKV